MNRSLAACTVAACLFLFLLTNCGTARQEATERFGSEEMTTIYLVRHAEKDYGDDPKLIAAGSQRAQRLREMLKNVDLAAVYATDTRRTRETAAPTAEDQKLPVTLYNGSRLAEFSDILKQNHRGKSVLVVGHSNTTPALTNFLTGTEDYPRFSELDYTNFYVVNIPRIGKTRVLKLRF